MGTEALHSAIEEEARTRVAHILDDARSQGRALRAEAEASVSKRRRQALRDEEAKLRRKSAARVAAARTAAQKRVLEAREILLERVFALARDQLPAVLDGETAQQWIVDLAQRALHHMPAGGVAIEASSAVAEALSRALSGREGLRIEHDTELASGFRVRSDEAALVVDVTLETLLELHRPGLAIDVLTRLAHEGGP